MPLFKGENKQESISMVIGSVLLVFGIVLLMIGFVIAFNIIGNPSAYLKSQMPDVESASKKGPRAEFNYTVNGVMVNFQDNSQQGDSQIVSWHWNFGDGQGDGRNQAHTYPTNYSATVTLTVRDQNDKESRAVANFKARPGETSSGNSMPDASDIGNSINFSDILAPLVALPYGLVAVFLVFVMLFIVWLVGASILKAGWNLIRPRPETIKVRIKPKDLQAEPVPPTTYAVQPQAPPPYVPTQMLPQQPPPPMQPPSQQFGLQPPPPEM